MLSSENPYFLNYQQLPLVIHIAIVVSIISVIGIFGAHLAILFRRLRGYREERRKKRLLPQFENLILNRLVLNDKLGTESMIDITLPVEECIDLGIHRSEATRRIFISYLMQLNDNISGKVNILIGLLYIELGLARYAEKKLYSSRPRRIILALNEISVFDLLVRRERINKLINHDKKLVREEAISYSLKRFKYNTFDVFDHIKKPISKWEHLKYFDIIGNRVNIDMPFFGKWIKPNVHRSLVMLCLDLVVHYQQFDALRPILSMLTTKDVELRGRLIRAVGKLYQPSVTPKLMSMYTLETEPECKIEILKALGRVGNTMVVPFLLDVFITEQDHSIKKYAIHSLYKIEPRSAVFTGSNDEYSKVENTLIKHVSNPLINYK